MTLPVCQFRGEESLSIVRRGKWVWKRYRRFDPRGIWPTADTWREQLMRRAEISCQMPHINPVQRWFPVSLVAVSLWVEAVRPTTDQDVAAMKAAAPKWLGDIRLANIIIAESGPVLIDFCVR